MSGNGQVPAYRHSLIMPLATYFRKTRSSAAIQLKYPAGNFFPANRIAVGFTDESDDNYRLAPAARTRTRGTDGKDLGADIPAVLDATDGVTSGGPAEVRPPAAVSVSPKRVAGFDSGLSIRFSDEKGFAQHHFCFHVIQRDHEPLKRMLYQFDAVQNGLCLREDTGRGWLGPVAVGSGGGLSNSQCTVVRGKLSAEVPVRIRP